MRLRAEGHSSAEEAALQRYRRGVGLLSKYQRAFGSQEQLRVSLPHEQIRLLTLFVSKNIVAD